MKKLTTRIMILLFGLFMLGTINSYSQDTTSTVIEDREEKFKQFEETGATETELRFKAVELLLIDEAKQRVTENNVNDRNAEGETLLLTIVREKNIKRAVFNEYMIDHSGNMEEEFSKDTSEYVNTYLPAGLEYFDSLMREDMEVSKQIIEYLISMGAVPQLQDDYCKVLFEAVKYKENAEIAIQLIDVTIENGNAEYLDIPEPPYNVTTIIGRAIKENNEKVAVYLIEKGVKVDEINDYTGRTLLHTATEKGQFEVADALIKSGKIDVNLSDNEEYTPLFIVIDKFSRDRKQEYLEIAKSLIDNGADLETKFYGKTPYENAVEFKVEEIAEYIKNKEASEKTEMLEGVKNQ
jgi:ankyrin repeat protein